LECAWWRATTSAWEAGWAGFVGAGEVDLDAFFDGNTVEVVNHNR
jgi:hypothetical protein